MKTRTNLATLLALSLAAAGCAADAPAPGDDDGGGGGGGGDGGGGGGDNTPPDAVGKYQLHNTFDLATNAPGTVGDVSRAIIDMTDSSDDPANYLLTQVINALPSGFVKNALNGAKPFVAGIINDRLLDIAPDFVTTFVQVGNDFGDITKNFGLNSTLDVTGASGTYTANHTVLGAHFKINGVETDYNFADYGINNSTVNGVAMTVDQTGKLSLADHKVAVSYGAVLRLALDAAIIPSLDPSATNLGQLLQHQVDCNAVGTAFEDAIESLIGFGPGSGTFTAACNLGLTAGANFIYSKITAIDGSALELGLTGTAKIIDKDGDHKLDTIQTGQWTGNATYAGTPAPLATATFFGARM